MIQEEFLLFHAQLEFLALLLELNKFLFAGSFLCLLLGHSHCVLFFLQLLHLLLDFSLFLLLLSFDLVLHLFEFFVEGFGLLEHLHLVLVSFFHCHFPVVGEVEVDERVYKQEVVVRADQDTVSVLQRHRFLDDFTVDADFEFLRVFLVGNQLTAAVVTVIDKSTLLRGNTNTFNGHFRNIVLGLLSDDVIAVLKSIAELTRHLGVLVDIPDLWSRSQQLLLLLFFCLLTALSE